MPSCPALWTRIPTWFGQGTAPTSLKCACRGKVTWKSWPPGGGIAATLKATRAASPERLLEETRQRAQTAFRYGTTTLEAKTGYGLDLETEF